MSAVYIRGVVGSFRVVIKPHPGVGQNAGNVFGIETHEAAVEAAAALAARWNREVTDET